MPNLPGQLITIRLATVDDAPAIARVHIDSWRSTYAGIVPDTVLDALDFPSRIQTWQREITDTTRQQFVYVAESSAGKVIGFLSGGPERTGEYPGYTGEIYALYVDDAWQGCGIGQRLLETGVQALLDQGHRAMLI